MVHWFSISMAQNIFKSPLYESVQVCCNIYHQYTPNVSINLPYIRILWAGSW